MNLYIFIIMLCFAVSGCSQVIRDNEENGETVSIEDKMSENNSFLQNEESSVDYNDYESKIWVIQNWESGAYAYSSFRITEVNENNIVGEFSTGAIAEPNFYFYSFNPPTYIGKMSGSVNGNIASLKFSDEEGNLGSIEITFDEGTILGDIQYTNQGNNYQNGVSDGEFVFKPFNIKNVENLKVITLH